MDKMHLNKETGKYEASFTLAIDAEIFQRILFKHIQENNVDVTDIQGLEQAIRAVSKAQNWITHPHVTITFSQENQAPVAQPEVANIQRPYVKQWFNVSEKQALRELAMVTPKEQWETLLTPLATSDMDEQQKNAVSQRRYQERKYLKGLEQEILSPERLELVANSVNGARMK